MISSAIAATARIGALAAVLALGASLGGGAPADAAERPSIFRIATASKSGTFYPIGSLLAKGITGASGCEEAGGECGVAGLIAVAQVSNGSVANVEAVSTGAIEAGLAQADVIYWAHRGEGRFAGRAPLDGFRAIANLYPGSLHIVARADSDIRSISDLRGKRVALDEPGSGTLATAELILASAGLGKDDIQPLFIKHNHAGPMLGRGELDAFFFVAGYPTGSVVQLTQTTPVRLVPLDAAMIARLTAERPYLAAGTIPAGAYAGLETDVPTVNIGTQLVVGADLDPDLVADITSAIWSQRTRRLLDTGHPKGAQVRLETALSGVAIPLHPGAETFYSENGLLGQ